MLEQHSVGLILAGVVSTMVYSCGLIVNVCDLVLHFGASPLIADIIQKGVTSATASFDLPVSLADWSRPVWGVVYGCQLFWLVFSLVSYFRQTPTGPAYNNPKIIPVPVHAFFSLTVVTQTGWLVMMDRGYVILATVLIIMAAACAVICVCESYRALAGALPILQAQERACDTWSVRLLLLNPVSFFTTWVILRATLTFAFFLTFALKEHSVRPQTGSLVQLGIAGFLVFVYVLLDLTILDQYTRFVFLPYVSFVLFQTAQLDKDWPDVHGPVFIFVAGLTAFTFFALLVKVIVVTCRQVSVQSESEPIGMNVVTRPVASKMDEETYLLRNR